MISTFTYFHHYAKIHKNLLKETEENYIFYFLCYIALEFKLKKISRTKFSYLKYWIGSVKIQVKDTTCISSFVTLGLSIQTLIGGRRIERKFI
jgi:hypothetical protein